MTVGGLFSYGDSLRKRHLSRDLKIEKEQQEHCRQKEQQEHCRQKEQPV